MQPDNSLNADHIALSPAEVRVLAVLAEKEALTPDNYPLSLNALTNGCNQLSSRDPVMALSETEVHQTLLALMEQKLVSEISQAGARVVKYEHRMRIKWVLEQDKLVVLTLLMLRGPQTAAEIRSRAGRMHQFSSVEEVESGLQFLIDKYPPLVVCMPRSPGSREVRYTHVFFGDEGNAQGDGFESPSPARVRSSSDGSRIAELENEVANLRAEVERLSQELSQFRKQFE